MRLSFLPDCVTTKTHCGFEPFELQVICPEWSQPATSLATVEAESLEVVLVFKDRAEADHFMGLLNLPVDEKYLNGELVAEALESGSDGSSQGS